MDQKIKEILEKLANLTKTPFIQNALTEKIIDDTGGEGLYNKIEVDLTVAHTDLKIPVSADRLTVESVDDAVTIKLNSPKNPTVDLQVIPEIRGAVKRIYVNNASGSGTLKLLAGSKGMVEFKKKLEIINSPNYIIYLDGTLTKAYNCETGIIEIVNSVSATVIQYAIDQLTSGGHIYIKQGEYTITAQISVKSDITLTGAGKSTILKAQNSLGTPNILFVDTTQSNIIIKDLCIDGNKANRVDGAVDHQQANIYVAGPDVLIDSCFMINSTRHSVYFGTVTCKRGIMQNCMVKDSGDHGLYVRNGPESIHVLGNIFLDCGRAGVRFGPTTAYCIADGNTVNGSGIDGASDPAFHSYDMAGAGTFSHYHIFSNNISIDADGIGFYDQNTGSEAHNIWIGNININSGHYGFSVGGNGISIIGNYCNITGVEDGIAISGNECLITGNRVLDAARRGIGIYGDHNIIANNSIPEAGASGIYVSGNYNIIKSNVTSVTGFYGIQELGDNNRLFNNDLSGCGTATNLTGTNVHLKGNIGYVSENSGASGVIADGGTIAHGLATTPTHAIITGSVAGEIVNVTGLGAANLTIAIKSNAGAAGTNQVIYWRAWV
jgi:hypothetical protein